jgi:RNA polymerase sigma-70 factor (ECF subfamily)
MIDNAHVDEAAFAAAVARHRRELQVHCYRMLGSLEDSEDLVQETFLRAWNKRESFEGRSSFRGWLYRIATNACLDTIARRGRQASKGSPEVLWLQPFPDDLLDSVASADDEPDAVIVAKETIELAFMVAIQHVPPKPRAVFILRDVLGWPAKDVAELLDTSVASVTSALQRARGVLQDQLPERRLEWEAGADPSAAQRELIDRYVEASEQGDAVAFAEMLHEDARFSMPPVPGVYVGPEKILGSWAEGGWGTEAFGELRHLRTAANRQPAVACYCRRPGDTAYRPMAIDVLRVEEGRIAEITTFGSELFGAFGLPETL